MEMREQTGALRDALPQIAHAGAISQSTLAQGGQSGKAEVQVSCPYCNGHVSVLIGNAFGSSAMPSCTSCDHRFHVHRSGTGGIFVREMGGSGRTFTVDCTKPRCPGRIAVAVPAAAMGTSIRWCLICETKLEIDQYTGSVISALPDKHVAATVAFFDGARDMVRCPDDQAVGSSFFKNEKGSYAVCPNCSRLLLGIPVPDTQQTATPV